MIDQISKFKQIFFSSNNYNVSWIKSINTYDDFSKTFSSKTCEICKFYPRIEGIDLYLCVICSSVLCRGHCSKSMIENNKGNLTMHAQEKHINMGIFLNISNGKLLVINFPILIETPNIFTSRLGKSFHEYIFDFKSYYLDKGMISKLFNAYFNQRFTQEFYNLVITEKYKIIRIPNWDKI